MLSVRRLNFKIKRESLKLRRYKEAMTQTVFANDGLPRSPNKKSTIERLAPIVLDAEKYLDKLKTVRDSLTKHLSKALELAFHLKAKILANGMKESYISTFDYYLKECETLIYRYAYDYSYRKIAQSLNYSVASVYRFHRTGLLFLGFTENEVHTLECS